MGQEKERTICWVGMRRDTEAEPPDGWHRTGGPGQSRKREAILQNLGRRERQEEGRSSPWARFSGCKSIRKRHKFYITMGFEFDPKKSTRNKTKHGIDFREAQGLWNDRELLEIPARTVDEPRFLVIGKLKDTHWSAVITYRAETVRIISVRRSRPEEITIYESARVRQEV